MKKFKLTFLTAFMSVTMGITAFAGAWAQDSTGWRYQNDDSSYPVSQWQTIDGKMYYFGADGYMLHDTITPDGFTVGSDGAAIDYTSTNASSPQLSTVTSTPTTVIGEGIYEVGTDISAGEYILFGKSEYSYYALYSDSSGSISSIIVDDHFSYNRIVKVNNGEYLELKDCTLSPINEVPQITYTQEDAMFKVGYHLPAGEYKLQTTTEYFGYYAVLADTRDGVGSVVSNKNFKGQVYITVEDGQYIQLKRCSITQ